MLIQNMMGVRKQRADEASRHAQAKWLADRAANYDRRTDIQESKQAQAERNALMERRLNARKAWMADPTQQVLYPDEKGEMRILNPETLYGEEFAPVAASPAKPAGPQFGPKEFMHTAGLGAFSNVLPGMTPPTQAPQQAPQHGQSEPFGRDDFMSAAGLAPASAAIQEAKNQQMSADMGRAGADPTQELESMLSGVDITSPDSHAPSSKVMFSPAAKSRGDVYQDGQGTTVDELEGDTASVLPHGQMDTVDMPRKALPEGAREGQTFAPGDINQTGGYGNPFAQPIPGPQIPRGKYAPGEGVFVDQIEDGTASILDPGQQNLQQIPTRALPEGAREGQMFQPGDVNRKGGFGNPFADPMDIADVPRDTSRDPGGNIDLTKQAPKASVQMVPAAQARGAMYENGGQGEQGQPAQAEQPIEPKGQRRITGYKVRLPSGEEWVYDSAKQEEAKRNQALSQVAAIDKTLAIVGQNHPASANLLIERNSILAQLDQKVAGRVSDQVFKQGMQNQNLEVKERMGDNRNETTIQAAKLRARKGSGAGGSAAAGDTTKLGLFARLPYKEQARIEGMVRPTMKMYDAEMNWNALQGKGIDRLSLAKTMINAEGPFAGTQHFEATMNFLGYIRGGVPAKNESQELHNQTNNISQMLNAVGKWVGDPLLGTHWFNGESSLDDADTRRKWGEAIGRMDPGQRKGLDAAIRASLKEVRSMGVKNIEAQAEGFESLDPAGHDRVTNLLNAKMALLGLPAKQFYADAPLRENTRMFGKEASKKSAAESLSRLEQLLGGGTGEATPNTSSP